MTDSITADVGSYGKVKGFTKGNVAEFRGIPFATIPARFRRAEIVTSTPGGTLDATKYGPYPAQLPTDKVAEAFLFGDYVKEFWAEEESLEMSEDKCLNLNIVTPKNALGKKDLPVLVWIYGGAFAIGGNSRKMYNGASLVQHSLEWDQPVVYVSINYRVNFFGFLASKELAKDNAAHGGGVGNYGLHDQRLALEWVQENIKYFGGDPAKVTIFGESAGSASVHAQIMAGKPLFSRAILQSGVLADCLGPAKIEGSRTQGDFDRLVKKFGLEGKDDQGKVDGLRAVPTQDLINAIVEFGPFPVFYPADDSHLPGHFFDKGRDETHQWLFHPNAKNFIKATIAGDCEVEGIIFARSLMTLPYTEVIKFLNEHLPEKLLSQYGLTKTQTADVTSINDLIPSLISLKTDELFAASIHRFTREFSKAGATVYSYHFDRGNTFSGPLKNVAHHALDLQYVFGNFLQGFSDKKDLELSISLMKFWIGFAYGKAPWDDVSSGKALHIRTDGELEVVPEGQIKSRRWEAYAEMEKIWDTVRNTGNALMNGSLKMEAT